VRLLQLLQEPSPVVVVGVLQVPLQFVSPLAQPHGEADWPFVPEELMVIFPLAVALSQLFALVTFSV
jgi:hypothetical protein